MVPKAVVDQRQRLVDHAELAQQLVDDAGPLQQREPGIGADQHAGPERQHHQRQDDDAPPFRRDARRIGNGITEQQRQHRHQQADLKRQRKAAPVDVLAPDPAVVLQRKTVVIDRLPGEPADRQHDQQQDHEQRRQRQRQHQALFATLVEYREVLHGAAHGDPAMARNARCTPRRVAGQNYFCMKPTQRFSAASPAGDDHQA